MMSQYVKKVKLHLNSLSYRIGLAVIQRNVRKFLFLRNWSWWKLYIKVQPLLSIARAEEEMKEKEEELKKAMENAAANEGGSWLVFYKDIHFQKQVYKS